MQKIIAICALACFALGVLAQETIRLRTQHAGDLILKTDEFSVFYDANWVPDDKKYSGPNHCLKQKINGFEDTFVAKLIVVADKDRQFNFTRQWLWNKLRPAIVNMVIPSVCPNADMASVKVFIKGVDIVVSGTTYFTDEINLPEVQKPVAAEFSKSESDFMNGVVYVPALLFNRNAGEFISNGIVWASFPTTKLYCESFGDSNCTYDKFYPSYRIAIQKRDRSLERKAREGDKNAMAKVATFYNQIDLSANFDDLAAQVQLEYKQATARQVKREEYSARQAYYASFWRGIDEAIEKHGFWTLFTAGLLGGNGQCQPSGSPLCSADYQAVQDAPMLFR